MWFTCRFSLALDKKFPELCPFFSRYIVDPGTLPERPQFWSLQISAAASASYLCSQLLTVICIHFVHNKDRSWPWLQDLTPPPSVTPPISLTRSRLSNKKDVERHKIQGKHQLRTQGDEETRTQEESQGQVISF